MIHHHDWHLTELEDMLPFERELYVDMLLNHLEEERQKLQANKQ
jgi:hypothetical protein